jgi:lipooligosaccharide transport system permease protein
MSIAGASYRSYRVWQRNRDVVFRGWFVEFVPPIAGPLMMLTALGLGLGGFVELDSNETYMQFLTPGVLALFPMMWAMFECGWGAFGRMTMQGIYDAVVATPLNVEDVIAGEVIWGGSRAALQGVQIMIAALILTPWYDLLQSPLAVFVLPFSLLYGVLFASMAMSYTSIAPSMSSYNLLFAFVINPMFWFSGAFYPIESLPQWAQVVALFIPLTHVVEMNRALIEGNLEWSNLINFAVVCAAAAAFFLLALRGMRRRLVH